MTFIYDTFWWFDIFSGVCWYWNKQGRANRRGFQRGVEAVAVQLDETLERELGDAWDDHLLCRWRCHVLYHRGWYQTSPWIHWRLYFLVNAQERKSKTWRWNIFQIDWRMECHWRWRRQRLVLETWSLGCWQLWFCNNMYLVAQLVTTWIIHHCFHQNLREKQRFINWWGCFFTVNLTNIHFNFVKNTIFIWYSVYWSIFLAYLIVWWRF